MKEELVKKVVFALVMGLVTTGIISFALIGINLGFGAGFVPLWLRSWGYAYLFVIPAILFIAPGLQRLTDGLVEKVLGGGEGAR